MSLLSKEQCVLCGNEVNTFKRIGLNNGQCLCTDCTLKAGITPGFGLDAIKSMTPEQILERIKEHSIDKQENEKRIQKFIATYKIGNFIWFDDRNKWFAIPRGVITKKIDKTYVFRYEEIVSCEILENGGSTSTTGGFGKAVVGGALFGITGAMAGATSKKTKQTCTELDVVITTKNMDYPTIYVKLLNTETDKNSYSYRSAYKCANNIVSKIKNIEANIASADTDDADDR